MRRDAILTGTIINRSIWHSRADQSVESACKASVKGVTEERPLDLDLETHERWMRLALKQAEAAAQAGEVPVGAVLIADGEVLAEAHNRPISAQDPTAHAEILALRAAAIRRQNYRLPRTTLYVTIEPCTMCVGALIHARIDQLVFGAREPRSGAVVSQQNLLDRASFNHKVRYREGVLAKECGNIMQVFFQSRR